MNFNNDDFRKALKTILTVAEILGQKISTSIEASEIDLKKLPPPEKWAEIYEQHTDSKVASTISQVGQQGWLFYDLVNFLPLTDFFRVLKQAETTSDHQSLDAEMVNVLEIALDKDNGGFDFTASALRNVDPVGAEKRVNYLNQMLAAYKTSEMYALIPPMAYAQLESLMANFSHQQILPGHSNAYAGIYNSRQKVYKFMADIQIPVSEMPSKDDSSFVLHISFLEHLKVVESVLSQLSKSLTTYDYEKPEDIERKASSPTSRHYVAHGGLGIDTQTHAAKAITTLVAAIALLHKIKVLKSKQMVN